MKTRTERTGPEDKSPGCCSKSLESSCAPTSLSIMCWFRSEEGEGGDRIKHQAFPLQPSADSRNIDSFDKTVKGERNFPE